MFSVVIYWCGPSGTHYHTSFSYETAWDASSFAEMYSDNPEVIAVLLTI